MTTATVKQQLLQLNKTDLADIARFIIDLMAEKVVTTDETAASLEIQRAAAKAAAMKKHGLKPMRKHITLEELQKEQNWKPMNSEEFFRRAKALDIQEPLEDLLAMLD